MSDYAPDKTLELPRISSATPAALEANYISRGIPVVLTDMTRDWPAMREWTLAHLREAAGDVQVPIRGNRHHFRLLGTIRLADYIDWLAGDRDDAFLDPLRDAAPYITHNRGITPYLEQGVSFERFAPEGYKLGKPAFWLGPKMAETPLHYDAVGIVFFAQVLGRKEAILFGREQSNLLYESDYFDFTTCYSRVNLRAVGHGRFPRFARAIPYRVILEPGDVLVFPRQLWHEFRAVEPSLSVTMHAGTARDYSYRNPMLLRERSRQVLHWLGLYARGRCSCHSNVDGSDWEACMGAVSNSMAVPAWARRSKALTRLVLAISRGMLHDRGIDEILGWTSPSGRAV